MFVQTLRDECDPVYLEFINEAQITSLSLSKASSKAGDLYTLWAKVAGDDEPKMICVFSDKEEAETSLFRIISKVNGEEE